MNKRVDSSDFSNVEQDLAELFGVVSADTAFVATLEHRLRAAKVAQTEPNTVTSLSTSKNAHSPRPRGRLDDAPQGPRPHAQSPRPRGRPDNAPQGPLTHAQSPRPRGRPDNTPQGPLTHAHSPRPRGWLRRDPSAEETLFKLLRLDILSARWFSRRRWALAALGVLLISTLVVTLIGPQQVWAGVQRFLKNYVPGLGFIHLDQAWMLDEPVEIERDGVVLRVEQVVASPERTIVQLETVAGLSSGMAPSPQTVQGSEIILEAYRAFEAFLRLPDGTRLPLIAKSLRIGKGTLAFPALPKGTNVRSLILEIPRLPLLIPDAAPEGWDIPLRLHPATELSEVQVYALNDASDTHEGITLRVLEVAHGLEETAIHAQVTWDPEIGKVWMPSTAHPGLGDIELRDAEHTYPLHPLPGWATVHGQDAHVLFGEQSPSVLEPSKPDRPTAPPTLAEEMWLFEPVEHSSYSLTLQINWFSVYRFSESLGFTIDLGDNPQAGDRWPLDIQLKVGDMDCHITEARLAKLSAREASDYPDAAWKLNFTVVPGSSGNQFLNRVDMTTAAFGTAVGSGGQSRSWTIDPDQGAEPRDGPISSWMYLRELPTGPVEIKVFSTNIQVRGPWVITW